MIQVFILLSVRFESYRFVSNGFYRLLSSLPDLILYALDASDVDPSGVDRHKTADRQQALQITLVLLFVSMQRDRKQFKACGDEFGSFRMFI